MGTVGNGGGGGWPPDGGGQSDGLPELPPEWGPIVVPDDPAELAAEAAVIRQELSRQARRDLRLGEAGQSPRLDPAATEPTSLRLPLLIMSIAVLATLTSLFAFTSLGTHPAPGQPTATTGAPQPRLALPALDTVDAAGASVPLRGLLPAAIILTDRCTCADLVAATAAAAPPSVTVVALADARSALNPATATQSASPGVRELADPTGELRGFLQIPPPGEAATVLLVAATGQVVRVLSATNSIEDYRNDLRLLAPR